MEQLGAPGFYHVIARYGYTQRVHQVRMRLRPSWRRVLEALGGAQPDDTENVPLLHRRPLSHQIVAMQSEDEVTQINKHILALLYRTLRFKMQHVDTLRVLHTPVLDESCSPAYSF